ncbi:mechanosensitive ion channel family protein [Pedobacter glucosidilyticus]|uniref:mechanosensitive ion channel family protein n=1 Tax=Pedobacter glucosidilyticus TaxID=1122941 RepID=UPI0026EED185|nr:mechanosensitive ion channel domain-containing protein [Pedobacter glucosidilyticus]
MKNLSSYLQEISGYMPAYVWNFTVLIAAFLMGSAIKHLILKTSTYHQHKTSFSFIQSALRYASKPLSLLFPLFVFYLMIPLLKLSSVFIQIINKSVEIAFIIGFAYLLINIINIIQDFVLHSYSLQKDDNLRERRILTQLQFIRKFFVAFIIILTIAAVLFSFEGMRKIGAGLLTGVGIGGIIIGFAAQKSLGNLLAGFQIAFTQPIRIDDVLVVENEWGRVEEITLTYVVLHIWDQRRLILPINYFIEKPFQNWTRTSSDILGTVFIYTDYNIPLDALRQEFIRLLNHTPLWDKKVQIIQVTDAKEQTIEIRALMSAGNSSKAFDLRCYIRENLIDFIQKNYPDSLPKLRASFSSESEITFAKKV